MNPTIFNTGSNKNISRANTLNKAGGHAYKLNPHAALAKYACTGTLGRTYYDSPSDETVWAQLEDTLELCEQVEPEFIAACALYSHEVAYMKDMPALLLAILGARDSHLLHRIFNRVITNGKMLRNFCQVVRSGALKSKKETQTNSKAFTSQSKKLVCKWLQSRSDIDLLKNSIGSNPTLGDIINMVHPKPVDEKQSAMFSYLIGRPFDVNLLSPLVKDYINAKEGGPVTELMLLGLPHRLLTGFSLSALQWQSIAISSNWTSKRMGLNTFTRNKVFEGEFGEQVTKIIASALKDSLKIDKAKAFPYQILTAWSSLDPAAPEAIGEALEEAMEIAISRTPTIEGNMVVLVDVSASMNHPVTGYLKGRSSKTTCTLVASLAASALLRKNPTNCEVIAFDDKVYETEVDPAKTVMANAEKLSNYGGYGTMTSCGIRHLNKIGHKGDLVIIISDNESWCNWSGDPRHELSDIATPTSTLTEWRGYLERNPEAKLVCLDITPSSNSQAPDESNIINIGGFSDNVFGVIESFTRENGSEDYWVRKIRDFWAVN